MATHIWHAAIRDAATVVLVRPHSREMKVYLMKRPQGTRAFAGLWAFPGGSIDPADRQWSKEFWRPEDSRRLIAQARRVESGSLAIVQEAFLKWAAEEFPSRSDQGPFDRWPQLEDDPQGPQSASVAAMRELFEETGVLLARPAEKAAVVGREIERWRRLMRAERQTWAQMWQRLPLKPDWSALGYLGRLTTPPGAPVRFQARFFVALLPDGQKAEGMQGASEEVADEIWLTPSDALAAVARGNLPAAMPTRYVLSRLAHVGNWDALRAQTGWLSG